MSAAPTTRVRAAPSRLIGTRLTTLGTSLTGTRTGPPGTSHNAQHTTQRLADLASVNQLAEAVVDLTAITDNAAALREHAGPAALMAVVKSDGYGHGMVPAAQAAVAGGAEWLGVTTVAEALALRSAGLTARVLCLLDDPQAAHVPAIAAGVDLGVSTAASVRAIAAAARQAGQPARVHLKADTGMSRGGATAADWPDLVDAALAAQAAGQIRITAIWSHLACADIPGHPSIAAQIAAFDDAVAWASRAGARPDLLHLANTSATLTVPQARYDLVRPGGGLYGLCCLPGGAPGWLRPAMTARTRLVQVKRVPAGSGVSYGHRYVTPAPTTLGLVPVGYADGLPRSATNTAQVLAGGRRHTIAGTVCMNQFVLDLGDAPAAAGDDVVLFGPGSGGEPTAQNWADALGTIAYEIVIGFGSRWARSYRGVTYGAGVP